MACIFGASRNKKKQEQDAALIKEYESALRDSTAFYQWQTTMREKDDAKRRQQVERRRLEMVASQKEAVEAAYVPGCMCYLARFAT